MVALAEVPPFAFIFLYVFIWQMFFVVESHVYIVTQKKIWKEISQTISCGNGAKLKH